MNWLIGPEKKYTNEIDLLILKRQQDPIDKTSLVNFAIDMGRPYLVENILSKDAYKSDENFVLHILKNHEDTSYLNDLWNLTREEHFSFDKDDNGDYVLHILSKSFDPKVMQMMKKILDTHPQLKKKSLEMKNRNGVSPLKYVCNH